MKHGSLFSGIGGFDLAAQWMGWENVFHCEIDPFCRKVLKYHFPNSKQHEDITKTDFTGYRGQIDILTGGFPCQPFSTAGKRKGKDDDRYLWPEMLRAIREIRPTWIIGENVAGITSMVQPGCETQVESQASLFETGDKETILEQEFVTETICRSLESERYSVKPVVIPACAVGAPHRRDRIWFIAHSDSYTTGSSAQGSAFEGCRSQNTNEQERRKQSSEQHIGCGKLLRDASNTGSDRLQRKIFNRGIYQEGWKTSKRFFKESSYDAWRDFPTESPVCSRNDGISSLLDFITFSKWRAESIKAYGNAIVPQVAFEIFKAIEEVRGINK